MFVRFILQLKTKKRNLIRFFKLKYFQNRTVYENETRKCLKKVKYNKYEKKNYVSKFIISYIITFYFVC